jgi:hypothetical protein
MSLADEVRTVRQRVLTRLRELEPLVREYNELVRLAGELGIDVPVGDGAARASASDVIDASDTGPAPTTGDNGEISDDSPTPARPDRATRSGGSPSTGGRGRKAAAGSDAEAERTDAARDARLLDALREKPGMTTAELATLLGVPATSLYRPVRELTNAGAIVKRGRGLYVG